MFRFFVSLVLTLSCSIAQPCTIFLLRDSTIMGKSFDWYLNHGMAVVNLRGLQKKSLLLDPSVATPIEWVSKYGSITFNQVAQEFPFSGMNEKGLAIEVLWLADAEYPDLKKDVATINESQWIQYLLDSAATTEEAIDLIQSSQIQAGFAPVHYGICDARKDCATVEYVNKKLVIHHGRTLPYATLANNTYDESLTYLKGFAGFGGKKQIKPSTGSLDRFVVATSMSLNKPSSSDPVIWSFEILSRVATMTQAWRISHDLTREKIRFSTNTQTGIKELDLRHLNFDCRTGVSQYLDMNDAKLPSQANIAFKAISMAENRQFIKKSDYLPQNIQKLIETYLSTPNVCVY